MFLEYFTKLIFIEDMIDERWFELYEKIMIRKLEIERDH